MKERDYYKLPKSTAVMRFLWKAAGGDRYLLERATYSDQIKYMCLGGIVFATGAMAGLAGGYAFYTIFSPRGSAIDNAKEKILERVKLDSEMLNPIQSISDSINSTIHTISSTDSTHLNQLLQEGLKEYSHQNLTVTILSILFGIIWGLIIFNIDRFIVTSTGRGDGTEAITWSEIKSAIPRIIMGMIIAITISKPVEIRMFKTEIDIKLHEKQLEQQSAYKAKTDSIFNSEIQNKIGEISKFENMIQEKIKRHAEIEKNYIEEVRIVTKGPRAIALEEQMKSVEREITNVQSNPEYILLKKEKNEIEKRREKALNDSEKIAFGLDGLLERIKIAHEVSGFWITLFITLLFMAIELTPIFFKLMLMKTPYDYLSENRDELIKAENGIEVRYDYYKDKEGQERHLVINHEAERLVYEKIKVTEIQKELADYAIEQYKNREKKKIDENLDEYIKSIKPDEQGNQQA